MGSCCETIAQSGEQCEPGIGLTTTSADVAPPLRPKLKAASASRLLPGYQTACPNTLQPSIQQ